MSRDHTQCVYEHWRPDLGQCFYVGRGPAFRANNLKPRERNKHHGRVVAKLYALGFCVEVRIFAGGLTVAEANAIEIARIAHYRHLGHPLTNQTAGGEGLTNPSQEVREKKAARMRGRKLPLDVRQKMSESHKNLPHRSPEWCANIAKAKLGRKRAPFKKRPHSEQTKRAISETLRRFFSEKKSLIQPSLFKD